MSEPLIASIERAAAKFVDMGDMRDATRPLDFSRGSLDVVGEMVTEAASWCATLPPDQLATLVQNIGCYVLEVGRAQFGGAYHWQQDTNQPILVVGEPASHVALMTWDKVRIALRGDPADNLSFFYDGFADGVARAQPGTRAVYV